MSFKKLFEYYQTLQFPAMRYHEITLLSPEKKQEQTSSLHRIFDFTFMYQSMIKLQIYSFNNF